MNTLRVAIVSVCIGLAASCSPTPTSTAANKMLVLSLWLDYPVAKISVFNSQNYKQYANVLVKNNQGVPMANARLFAIYITANGTNKIKVEFPPTDSTGQSRTMIPLAPIGDTKETHIIIAHAVLGENSSNEAKVTFEVMP